MPVKGSVQRRRLSAVMFTDMVGYSAATQENEELALELLDEHRQILRKIFPKYSGREIDTAGDAFFVEFSSALEATLAAIDIQRTLHERNLRVEDRRAIRIRIGLHLGDVVHVGDQVQGDGVNIAARMEPLANAGSICISEDVARQVHNKIDLPIAPLGRRPLKNIRLPVNAYRIVMPWEDGGGRTKAFPALSRGARRSPTLATRVTPRWVYAAVVVVAAAATLWVAARRPWFSRGESSADTSASVVAVLPFSVQGSRDFGYLGHGMVDLLSTKLDGAGDLRTVDPRAILGSLQPSRANALDPESGRKVAERLGAGSFILGSIVEANGRLSINAAVYPVARRAASQQGAVEGDATEIFDLVDGLAAQLLVFDGSGPGAPVERLEQMTTSSFDALKHYLQGVRAFRSARFRLAADELKLAVGLDSAFALAWYQLSSTADWLFDHDLSRRASERALRLKDRLSERGRRLVEALHAGKSGRTREGIRLYREYLASYPDDVEAWYQMGELQFHAGHLVDLPVEQSRTAWDRLLYFEPDQVTALIHSARIALLEGDLAAVDSMAHRIVEIEPAAERNVEFITHLSLRSVGDTPTGEVAALLRAADDNTLGEVAWSLGAFRDSPRFAAAIVPYFTDPTRHEEVRGLGHVMDGYLLAAQGRLRDAHRAFDRAQEIGYEPVIEHRALLTVLPFRSPDDSEVAKMLEDVRSWNASSVPDSRLQGMWYSVHDGLHEAIRYYLVGTLEAMTGGFVEALEAASRLEELSVPPATGSIATDFALAVRAEVARRQGDRSAAEAILNRAERRMWYQYSTNSSLAAQSRERFIRGLILEEQGRLEEAIRTLSFFSGYSLFDWIYIAPSHLRRAMMYERLGERRKAVEHYTRFVTLWADCDDELRPAVEEARTRLHELGPIAAGD